MGTDRAGRVGVSFSAQWEVVKLFGPMGIARLMALLTF
jgi:hypothetical protein